MPDLLDDDAFVRELGRDSKTSALLAARDALVASRKELAVHAESLDELRQGLDDVMGRMMVLEAAAKGQPSPQSSMTPRPQTTGPGTDSRAPPAQTRLPRRRIRVNFVDPPRPPKKERVIEVEVR